MIVDCHCHLSPGQARRQPALSDVPGYLDIQAEAGIDVSMFSSPFLLVHAEQEQRTELAVTQEYNDFAANLTAQRGQHLQGLAAANPMAGEPMLRETERAVREYGLKGIFSNTSVRGEYLDSPQAEPFWQLIDELDVPVFLHPPAVTIGAQHMQEWRLVEMLGRPFDSMLTLARMMHGGVFDRHPNLKLIVAHVGGAITALAGRLDFGYEFRDVPSFGPWGPNTSRHPPSTYVKRLFLDTMGLNTPHVACAIAHVGVEHLVLGTDFPPVPIPLERSLGVVRQLDVSPADKDKILGGNAARMFGLQPK